nr:hypothetical protein [Nanoarchaeum sp.]
MTNILQTLDEEILRYYTNLGMKIPEKTLYRTTAVASLIGGAVGGYTSVLGSNAVLLPLALGVAKPTAHNVTWSIAALNGYSDEETDGETASIDPFLKLCKTMTINTRLPILAGSIALGVVSYNLFNQETPNLEKAILLGVAGVSYFALASAMYLNDRKPKLLQRDSLLTQAYHKVKDALTPQPTPVPVPVRNYSTLESAL